jgi:predicted DNA-binding protein (MmcQ/YjbR family)
MTDRRLERLRQICLAFPDAIEKSEGMPTLEHHARTARVFRVHSKTFAWYLDNHHGDGRVAVWCKAPPATQEVLVRANPDRFFVPPYVGRRGWIGLRLDGRLDWSEVEALVEDSYLMTAPERRRQPLREQRDQQGGPVKVKTR